MKPATSIDINVPLKTAPKKGIKVAYITGNIAVDQVTLAPFKTAAADLGWKAVLFTYDTTNPQSVNSAVLEAVSQKVNYIVVNSEQSTAYEQGLAAAKAAGIPVVQSSVEDETNAAARGIAGCAFCNATDLQFQKILNDWMIADSGGHADVLFVIVPDFPETQKELSYDGDYLSKNCSGCTLQSLSVSVQDFAGGQVPSEVAAYLQSHPNVSYVDFPFGGLGDGVRQALKTAGIGSNVKFVAAITDLQTEQGLHDGSWSAALPLSAAGGDYQTIDLIARLSEGMNASVTVNSPSPTILWTNSNPPANPSAVWPGPADMDQQYKTLWKVG